jgi:HD superfamily phosphodiesterase
MGAKLLDRQVEKALEEYFGDDFRRIKYAKEVYSIALRINEVEGGDRDVVAMAALLHDVGIKPAEKLYGSSQASYQEKLGPPVAREILTRLGVGEDRIAMVSEIVASHHTKGKVMTFEFACIWDADMIVNLKDSAGKAGAEKIGGVIEDTLMTVEGKRIARELLLR